MNKRDFIKSTICPEIDCDLKKASTSSTSCVPANVSFPNKVESWDFEHNDEHLLIQNLEDDFFEANDNQLVEPYPSLALYNNFKINDEAELRSFFLTILVEVFMFRIFKNGKCAFNLYSRNTTTSPDIMFEKTDKFYVFFEMKYFTVLKYSNEFSGDLVDYYNTHAVKRSSGNSGKYCKCVDQLYTYMLLDRIKYGVLSSVNTSWFFKCENDRLYITRAIYRHELLQYLFKLFLLSTNDKNSFLLSNSKHLNFKLKLKNDNNNEGVPMAGEIILFDLQYFTSIGSGSTCKVFKATKTFSHGYEHDFAVKVVDLKNKKNNDYFSKEISILKYLQRNKFSFLPKFYGSKKVGWSGFLVFDYVDGKNVDFTKCSDSIVKNCLTILESLHDLNIVHNDLDGNFFIDRDSQKCFLLDYGRAEKVTEKSQKKNKEKKNFEKNYM